MLAQVGLGDVIANERQKDFKEVLERPFRRLTGLHALGQRDVDCGDQSGGNDFQDHVFRQHLVAADLENLLVDDVLDGIRRAFAMLSGPSRVIRQCEPSKHQTADDSDPPSNSHH